ncbi:MAG TPA: DinB family protein [Thermoanaerobaculia bacterium]|nr:DinB family protein [Thermoanaerobaculia bacterium]
MKHLLILPALFTFLGCATTMDDPVASVPVQVVAESSMKRFGVVHGYILRAAEKIPDELYSLRPVPEVRSIAELFGHIADSYKLVCGSALGEPLPEDVKRIEHTTSTKADLIQALTTNKAYCDRAHELLSGAKGAEMMPATGGLHPRVTLLFYNTAHSWEHYGNLVTYMRINGIVPPSSERAQK